MNIDELKTQIKKMEKLRRLHQVVAYRRNLLKDAQNKLDKALKVLEDESMTELTFSIADLNYKLKLAVIEKEK